MKYKPEDDGITHINIYSKGRTELGRWLSNFSSCSIWLPEGNFSSIEGYWYYLICNNFKNDEQSDLYWIEVNRLKNVHGFEAKNLGRKLSNNIDWCESDKFKESIQKALASKILGPGGKLYLEQFEKSTLPFTHYYNYSGKTIEPKKGKWVIEYIERLRKAQKKFKKFNNNKSKHERCY